ncbi:MAG: fibronectin type III domain-containing protein, partial [Aphanocapsa feldmannii 288cV]
MTVTTLAVPATPTGLTATPGDKQVSLSWSDSADDTIIGYEVSSDGGETFSAISGSDASTTSHTVTGLTNATNYTFAVRAVNGAGNSAAATLTATTPLWSAPTNLVAAADNKRVVLQWDRGDPGIEKYLVRVERASDNHDLLDKLVSLSPKSETTTITDISSLANG